MADSFTPYYNLVLPTPGGDTNTWGTLLNGNTSAIDTAIHNALTAGQGAFQPTGGTLTGDVTIALANAALALKDTSQTLPAGLFRFISSGGAFILERNTAAAGDFSTNTQVATFSAGDIVTLLNRPLFGANTPWDSGNFSPSNYAALAGAAFTGAVTGTSLTLSGDLTAKGAVIGSDGLVIPNNVGLYLQNSSAANVMAAYFSPGNVIEVGNGAYPLALNGTALTMNGTNVVLISQFLDLLSLNGFLELPNGFIIAWGTQNVAANTTSNFSFPGGNFPNACLGIVASPSGIPAGLVGAAIVSHSTYSLSNAAPSTAQNINWIAVGY